MPTNVQDVVKTLQMLSGKTDTSYNPNPYQPKGFGYQTPPTPQMPSIPPQIQETINTAQEKHSGISILVGISYRSMSGNFKDRDILIRRVVHNKNEMYIDGMAMDIRAPRLIKVSEITRVRDIGTGRIYDNPYQFLHDKLGVDIPKEVLPEQKETSFLDVIKRMHNEIAVLMYVVALDGIREKAERMAVAKYVRSQTKDLTYSDEDLNDYLISIAPDAESAGMAFQHILLKDNQSIQSFVEALIDVIMSNGQADEKERVFLAKIMDLLEQQGFQFNISL